VPWPSTLVILDAVTCAMQYSEDMGLEITVFLCRFMTFHIQNTCICITYCLGVRIRLVLVEDLHVGGEKVAKGVIGTRAHERYYWEAGLFLCT
jgi:hypothetical protein